MGWIILLLIWLVVPAVAGVVIRAVLQRRYRDFFGQGSQPRCARCGYPIRGLPHRICPECGGDLRRVGVEWS